MNQGKERSDLEMQKLSRKFVILQTELELLFGIKAPISLFLIENLQILVYD
jgi:hypothetical protein